MTDQRQDSLPVRASALVPEISEVLKQILFSSNFRPFCIASG